MTMAPAPIEAARGRYDRLIANRGYDSNAIRAAIGARGAGAAVPPAGGRKTAVLHERHRRPLARPVDLARQHERQTMAPALIEAAGGRFDRLIAKRGYDSNAIRAAIAA